MLSFTRVFVYSDEIIRVIIRYLKRETRHLNYAVETINHELSGVIRWLPLSCRSANEIEINKREYNIRDILFEILIKYPGANSFFDVR